MKLLSVDIGGTFIKYGIYNQESDQLVTLPKQPTPQTNTEDLLAQIQAVALANAVSGVAISMPGTLDVHTGVIYQGGSLQYNNGVNIIERLEPLVKVPVTVENDARCAALAELWRGNLQGVSNGLVLVLGTGLGGGVIINGDIYRGSHQFAGELSIIMTRSLAEYGGQALLGAQVGIPAFVKHVADLIGEPLDGPAAFDLIEQGNPVANQAFDEYVANFVPQLFNFQIAYDPERILIGGGISNNPVFITRLSEQLEAFYQRLPITIGHQPLGTCKFGSDANLLGAIKHYLDVSAG